MAPPTPIRKEPKMTGEMAWIKPDGIDSDGEYWPYHAELAERLGGTLCAFDKYQGPYILVGTSRVWLSFEADGHAIVSCEPVCIGGRSTTDSAPTPCDNDAIEAAARTLLNV